MTENNEVTFLCGKVMPGSTGLLSLGIIQLKNRDVKGLAVQVQVKPNDPGLAYIAPNNTRMVIARNGLIVAVFGRPRIKLLRMLERGANITQDLIDCFSPMYPKPEKIFRTTRKWKNTPEFRMMSCREALAPIVRRFYS